MQYSKILTKTPICKRVILSKKIFLTAEVCYSISSIEMIPYSMHLCTCSRLSSVVHACSFRMEGKLQVVDVHDRHDCEIRTAVSAQTIVVKGRPGCEEVTQYLEEECSKEMERSPGTW